MASDRREPGLYPIFLDIEVLKQYPEPWLVEGLKTKKPPGNMKKEATISEWRRKLAAEGIESLREQSSLEALYGGTIFAIGVAIGGNPVRVLGADPPDEVGEKSIMERLQAGLSKVDPEMKRPIVTFNGNSYDLPFIAKRAIRHGLFDLAQRCYDPRPFSTSARVDLHKVWQGAQGKDAKGRLHDVARFLGIKVDDDVQGGDVQSLFESGDKALIASHCAEDVRLTREIYWWFRAAGFIRGTDDIPTRVVVAPRSIGLPSPSPDPAEGTPAVTRDMPPAEATREGEDSDGSNLQKVKAECIAMAYTLGVDIDEIRRAGQLPPFAQMTLNEATELLVAINERPDDEPAPEVL